MTAIAIAERMPYDFERDYRRRVWWGVPAAADWAPAEHTFTEETP